MWMEPERMGRESKLAKAHPDWWITLPDGQKGTLLDLTKAEVVDFVINAISRVIEENELDLFRLDYNCDTRELFYLHSDGSGENASVKHDETVCTIWKTVAEKYPHVIFENCASGGGRCDAKFASAFHHTWVTDDQVPPLSRVITNGMSLVMPPERMDRLVGGMWSHELGSLDYHMRNAMTGHISMNVFSGREPLWNPEQLGFIRHSIEIYKDFIRPFLPTSLIYHHTLTEEEYRTGTPSVIEVASWERDRAAITVLTSPLQKEGNITVRPRGIDPKGSYRVTLDNSGATASVSGFELLQRGISVYLPAALTSELILIEAE
jgi:alpha-galactosidase